MSTEEDPLIGQMIQNFEIVSLLGQGGVGKVYLAKQPNIGKKIAVKVLRKEFAQDQTMMARFLREAQAVNEIRHENVIDIFNFVHQDGQTFILMEYLEGRPLSALIEKGSVFDTHRIANIALQICSALYATHAKGIIHRDLKPDNIFLLNRAGQRDFTKLLDFGLARSDSESALSTKTPAGTTLGTPAYMAPEQAMGDTTSAQTDIYSLGVILYEMATGRPPFFSKNAYELMKLQVLGTPKPPSERNPGIDRALEEVILRCLEKERKARYANMRALALGLGYAAGIDPTLYFQRKDSSADLKAVALPQVLNPRPKAPVVVVPSAFTSDSEPDLGKTMPEQADPQQKTDPGETTPGESGPRTVVEIVLTESMVEAASVEREIVKPKGEK